MLDKFILKEDLIQATANKEYPEIWDNITQAIKNHIEQYGLVEASYTGMIMSTPPVPSAFNVVPHFFHIMTNILGSNLATAGQAGLPALLVGLSYELSKTTVFNCTTTNFIMPSPSPIIPVTVNFSNTPNDQHEDVMANLANAIIDAFLVSLPVPPVLATPSPIVAIDGSVGLLTFVSII